MGDGDGDGDGDGSDAPHVVDISRRRDAAHMSTSEMSHESLPMVMAMAMVMVMVVVMAIS